MEATFEQEIYAALEGLGIPFELYRHEAAYTMEQCRELDERLGLPVHCKNLFLCNRQKTAFYLLLIDAGTPFKTAVVSKRIGVSRLSFGEDEKLFELLRTHPGAVNPFGLMYDKKGLVRLIVDERLKHCPRLAFHPNVNTATVTLSGADFYGKFLPFTLHAPEFADITPLENE